jgi:hypothetical protein
MVLHGTIVNQTELQQSTDQRNAGYIHGDQLLVVWASASQKVEMVRTWRR